MEHNKSKYQNILFNSYIWICEYIYTRILPPHILNWNLFWCDVVIRDVDFEWWRNVSVLTIYTMQNQAKKSAILICSYLGVLNSICGMFSHEYTDKTCKQYFLCVRSYRIFRQAEILRLCITDKFNWTKLRSNMSFKGIQHTLIVICSNL